MIKKILLILQFLIRIHKNQIIWFGFIYLLLSTLAIIISYNEITFFFNTWSIIIFAGHAILIFIFSAYLGKIFKCDKKTSFLSPLPFSASTIEITPYLLIFIYSIVSYFSLKPIWDAAHLYHGVSETIFLFFCPYIVFYSIKKLESIWAGTLCSIVLNFLLIFPWIKIFAIWSIHQFGILVELTYLGAITKLNQQSIIKIISSLSLDFISINSEILIKN